MSHSRNSEANYLAEDTSLLNLQNRIENMSIYDCSTLRQELDFKNMGIDVSPKAYAYNEGELFLSIDSTKSQRTQGICDYLFSNIRIKDQVELMLFHKELNELKKETDSNELEVIHRKWKPDYQEKYIAYQSKILSYYNRKLEDNESWYKYNKENCNDFLIELDKDGKINELKSIITKTKNEYEGYFDTFQLEIDYSHINPNIAAIEVYFNSSKPTEELKEKLLILIKKGRNKTLGVENDIDQLKKDFPEIFELNGKEKELIIQEEKLGNIQDIEEIYSKIKIKNSKAAEHNDIDTTGQINSNIPINYKQVIFQGSSEKSDDNIKNEITGAHGEVEVLIYLIKEFLKLTIDVRKKAIEAIQIEMQKHVKKNNSFETYANDCLEVISDDDKLSKALISLLFVSKKHKYANFDLITYQNGKPKLIEVKTTNNINSKKFFISIGEVNTARKNQDYEIVRVTPKSIIFMGNPIIEIDKNIREIKTKGFELKPRNYEFIIN